MDESLAGREQEKAKMVFKRCLFEDASQLQCIHHSRKIKIPFCQPEYKKFSQKVS